VRDRLSAAAVLLAACEPAEVAGTAAGVIVVVAAA
jgi:hypothetical protein